MRIKKHAPVVFAAGLLAFAAAGPATAAGVRLTPAEASLLSAVNQARAAHGLAPVHLDAALERASRAHSAEMLRGEFFAHGAVFARLASFHVNGPVLGENLAWGTGSYGTASGIVAAWLASPEHRANLLRPGFTRIGIAAPLGTFLGNAGASVVTADFAGS
jgi:uncharacterized protein YkwD